MAESQPRRLEEMLSGAALNTERTLLGAQVVDRLRELVVSGRLAPGTKLIQGQVAAELNVSRTPLREAIRILVHEGLLMPIPSSGSVQVVELSDRDARELYEVREVIDGLAARLCATRGLPATQLKHIENLAERLEGAAASERFDVNVFVSNHATFHLAILEASGNGRVRQLEPMVSMSAQMLFRRLNRSTERMRHSAEEHRAILDAIRSRDSGLAESLAREHIRTANEFWLSEAAAGEGQSSFA